LGTFSFVAVVTNYQDETSEVKTKTSQDCLKGRVERIFFFASFKRHLFIEYEMVFIMA